MTVSETLYRRELPESLIAFSSPRGREIFRDALAAGSLEGWFALAEQFHTQADPAYCGLASLVVALNALGVDPKRSWKGAWRWYSEELLDCCVPLPEVSARGLTLAEVACLARCNALAAEVKHAEVVGLDELRADVARAGSGDGSVVIAAYSRGALGQTGDGHFSPLAGLDAAGERALVLDVARFKYPPHWVDLRALHAAMAPLDPACGKSRGWLVLRRRHGGNGQLASLACGHAGWRDVVTAFEAPLARWRAAPPGDLSSALAALAAALPALAGHVVWREPTDVEHGERVARMRHALRKSRAARALAPHTHEVELGALVVLVLAPRLRELGPAARALAELGGEGCGGGECGSSDGGAGARAGSLGDDPGVAELEVGARDLAAEVSLLQQQLAALTAGARR